MRALALIFGRLKNDIVVAQQHVLWTFSNILCIYHCRFPRVCIHLLHFHPGLLGLHYDHALRPQGTPPAS